MAEVSKKASFAAVPPLPVTAPPNEAQQQHLDQIIIPLAQLLDLHDSRQVVPASGCSALSVSESQLAMTPPEKTRAAGESDAR